jgi:hypothetical protein
MSGSRRKAPQGTSGFPNPYTALGDDRPRSRLGAGLSATEDVLQYSRGSNEHGIERGGYATLVAVNPRSNLLTVRCDDGGQVTYDPRRLQGDHRLPLANSPKANASSSPLPIATSTSPTAP